MSVNKRKCFYETVGGTIRPFEWAMIDVTGFGPMVEPSWPFECNSVAVGQQGTKLNDDFSGNNDFQAVSSFIQTDEAGLLRALNNGDQDHPWLHGGRNYPRSGR